MRVPEVIVTALAIAAAAVWVAALVTSLPPPAPVIVVQGEPVLANEDAPWALRFVAVAPGGSAPLDVTGTVRLGDQTATIEYGTARFANARAGTATFDVVAGGVPAHGSYDMTETNAALAVDGASLEGTAPVQRAVALVHWTPWYGEVAMRSAATSAVYPLDGRVSARLPSHVLLVEQGASAGTSARVVELQPRASGAALDDGRVLHVDRSGLRVEGVLELEGRDVIVQLHSTEARRVACDLLVDGTVHEAVNVDARPPSQRVSLRMGLTRRNALVVVHCGGLYSGDVGRVVLTRAAPEGQLAPWLRDLARSAGAPDDEPLLALDDATLARPAEARAALARLSPSKVRAPRLDVTWTLERGPAATLRLIYAALAIAVVAAALVLGFLRMSQRRGSVIFAVAALAAVLGGLYAALVVVAGG